MRRAFLFGILFSLARGASAIGGGQPNSAELYPVSAYVGIEVVRDGLTNVCSGFLLNADTVVTAARCFAPFNPRPVSTVLLFRTRDLGNDRADNMTVPRSDVVVHPEYLASKGARRDWAVIKLPKRFKGQDKAVHPLPRADTQAAHYGLYGYGFDENGRQGVLRRLFSPATDLDAAADSADSFVFNHAQGVGLCGGDEGGPVLVNFDNVAYVVGLATPDFPAGGGSCPGRSRVSKIAPVMQWLKSYADGTAPMPDDAVVPGGGGKP